MILKNMQNLTKDIQHIYSELDKCVDIADDVVNLCEPKTELGSKTLLLRNRLWTLADMIEKP